MCQLLGIPYLVQGVIGNKPPSFCSMSLGFGGFDGSRCLVLFYCRRRSCIAVDTPLVTNQVLPMDS